MSPNHRSGEPAAAMVTEAATAGMSSGGAARARLGVLSALLGGLLIGFVRAYQVAISPVLVALFGPRCRFYPSCSAYAVESLRVAGPIRGSWLSLRRLLRCHPFHPGGYDPPVREP